jgi:hypothetical protein
VKIPSTIRAGDTIEWWDDAAVDALRRPIGSSTHELTYYLRTNGNAEAATVNGAASGDGWAFTISSTISGGFDAGDWYFQAVATALSGGAKTTLGAGSLTVLPNLGYAGTAGAFDGRSQAEKDLDAVNAAIRALMTGGAVREYRINERQITRYSLSELLVLQSRLKAEVAREKKAELIANGLGNPHSVFVRFGPRNLSYPLRPGTRW